MEALASMRNSLDLPPVSDEELSHQAMVMVHALYAKGWTLRELPGLPEDFGGRPL